MSQSSPTPGIRETVGQPERQRGSMNSSTPSNEEMSWRRRRSSLRALVDKVYPYGFKAEAKEMVKIAWPIIVTQVLNYCTLLIGLIFAGQLGKITLDGVSLAMTIVNVLGFSVMTGLSTALDTLFAQIVGSENKFKVGIVLQRAILLLMLISLPCAAIFINTEHFLKAFGQHEEVARESGKFNTIFVCGLPGYALTIILMKYLQAQSIVWPSLIIELICNAINAGIQATLVFGFKAGILGPAIGTMVTQYMMASLHLAFIYCSGAYKSTWKGWSWECLNDWTEFIKLAIPGFLMLSMEWWGYEVLVFLSGLLGVIDLAAMSVTYNLAAILYMGPLGLSVAACVRVGNHLGANYPTRALTASRVAIFMGVCLALFYSVTTLALREFLPYVFTSDRDVVHLSSRLLYQLALFVVFDTMAGTTSGILRGMGRMKFGAISNFITYYMVALPVAIPLLLATPLGVSGAWWGMMLGNGSAFIIFTIRIIVANWEKEAAMARTRTGSDFELSVPPSDMAETNSTRSGHVNYAYHSDDSLPSTETSSNEPIHVNGSGNGANNSVISETSFNGKVKPDTVNGVSSRQPSISPGRGSLMEVASAGRGRRTWIIKLLTFVVFLAFLISSIILRIYLDNQHG